MADDQTDKTQVIRQTTEDYFSLQPGSLVGRYEIISVLGQGGFGITYRARDTQLQRDVAIKEYLPSALAVRHEGITVIPRSTQMADDFLWGRSRFLDEARTMARFADAPAIVRVHEFLESNGTAYVVMPLLRGETLEARLKREGRLPPAAIEHILHPLLDGLEQVHAAGFLHRDIKPANIILNADGTPTLIDFGASRAAMAGRSTAMTAIFTPGYAAAEQFTSAKQGPWTDIYGLSATLYHAITGRPPPSAFDRMLDDTSEPLARLQPAGFAPSLLIGIDAGLAVRQTERPQSIAGWRSLLGGAAFADSDATIVARPQSAPPAVPLSVARKNRPALVAGLAFAMLALAGGGYFLLAPKPAPQVTALQDLKVEDLEKVLADRRKADATAAEKKRQEEEAQKKATDEGASKQAADADLEKAQQQRRNTEEELAKLKAEIEARRKEEQTQAKRAEAEAAQRKAEAEIIALRQAEDDAHKRAAAEADAKRLADEALGKAQAERQKADAEAKQKAEAEARQRAESGTREVAEAETRQKAEAAVAADRKAAEAAEAALRLGDKDRQKIQVALTALGFPTGAPDGSFGPRSREMIGGWQKAKSQPATGFLTVAQQQALLNEAAPAVAKFDAEQKKIEEDRKKAEEEAKAKAAAAPAPAPAATAPAPAAPVASDAAAYNGQYTGAMSFSDHSSRSIAFSITDGVGTGTTLNPTCGPISGSVKISPAGDVTGTWTGYTGPCVKHSYTLTGRISGNQMTLRLKSATLPLTGSGTFTR